MASIDHHLGVGRDARAANGLAGRRPSWVRAEPRAGAGGGEGAGERSPRPAGSRNSPRQPESGAERERRWKLASHSTAPEAADAAPAGTAPVLRLQAAGGFLHAAGSSKSLRVEALGDTSLL